jgi:transposase
MPVTTLGIDLAKNLVQVHGVDQRGHVVLTKRLPRAKVLPFLAQLPPCLIGLEASGGAHYWARELTKLGHMVKLMSPQFVRPYVQRQKNDANDAAGICEAVSRPQMRFVPIKSVEQQDMQALHRIRERQIKARTALVNQIRGLLAEYGIVIPQGVAKVRQALPALLADAENGLSWSAREWLWALAAELRALDQSIVETEHKIQRGFEHSDACQRLAQMEGIGPLTATALVAAVGDATTFKNGRQLAAWLGLVPRQHSSGGKPTLLGISKGGQSYLRKLLIHGARAVIRTVERKTDARSRWLQGVKARRGTNRACVAHANKTARIAWVLLAKGERYRRAACTLADDTTVTAG